MTWLAFVAGAVLSWGVYGAMLHQGQVRLGSPMRALLCVGVAYFLVGVVVPVITLFAQGQGLRGFTAPAPRAATVAGTLGALGAVCIIFSFRTGGTPTYVMPLVFGGAPLVNVLYTMATHPPEDRPEPDAVPRLPGHRHRRGHGPVFQADGLKYRTRATCSCSGATCSHVRRCDVLRARAACCAASDVRHRVNTRHVARGPHVAGGTTCGRRTSHA